MSAETLLGSDSVGLTPTPVITDSEELMAAEMTPDEVGVAAIASAREEPRKEEVKSAMLVAAEVGFMLVTVVCVVTIWLMTLGVLKTMVDPEVVNV